MPFRLDSACYHRVITEVGVNFQNPAVEPFAESVPEVTHLIFYCLSFWETLSFHQPNLTTTGA
jgi:hypothetical protein